MSHDSPNLNPFYLFYCWPSVDKLNATGVDGMPEITLNPELIIDAMNSLSSSLIALFIGFLIFAAIFGEHFLFIPRTKLIHANSLQSAFPSCQLFLYILPTQELENDAITYYNNGFHIPYMGIQRYCFRNENGYNYYVH
jgi:hypothetical protein